jgi:MFS family permease
VSLYGVGVLAGRFVWGSAVSRIGLHRALVAYAAAYGLSIFLFVIPSSLPAVYATTVLLGLGIAGAQQLNVQAFPDYFGRRIVGALFGYSGLLLALTGPFAPLFAAAAFDQSGSYSGIFLSFGVLCLLAAVAFFFSKPSRTSDVEGSPATRSTP